MYNGEYDLTSTIVLYGKCVTLQNRVNYSSCLINLRLFY